MNENECYNSIKKCPKFDTCNVPLCPLDPNVNCRVYHKGEPICKQPIEILRKILGADFSSQYKKFIRACLKKEARFTPLKSMGNLVS